MGKSINWEDWRSCSSSSLITCSEARNATLLHVTQAQCVYVEPMPAAELKELTSRRGVGQECDSCSMTLPVWYLEIPLYNWNMWNICAMHNKDNITFSNNARVHVHIAM
ncbi:hypothetical protein FKM82_026881 [Ascaphus truei]